MHKKILLQSVGFENSLKQKAGNNALWEEKEMIFEIENGIEKKKYYEDLFAKTNC